MMRYLTQGVKFAPNIIPKQMTEIIATCKLIRAMACIDRMCERVLEII